VALQFHQLRRYCCSSTVVDLPASTITAVHYGNDFSIRFSYFFTDLLSDLFTNIVLNNICYNPAKIKARHKHDDLDPYDKFLHEIYTSPASSNSFLAAEISANFFFCAFLSAANLDVNFLSSSCCLFDCNFLY